MSAKSQALQGLRIADFGWAGTVPIATTTLGAFGATVVRVEAFDRPDVLRVIGPFKDNVAGLNRSGYFLACNSNKYSIALNLKQPKGLEIAKNLCAWADIVTENFTPGSIERMGLGYKDLQAINPDLIMVSGSVQGQTGPFAQHPGFGHLAQGLTGINHVTGWRDRDPLGPASPTPDFIAPYYIVMALLTALERRRQTGKGQYIDLSQLEVTAHFMAAGLLDAWFNSPGMTRRGNQSDDAAPHGIYPCKGADRWCAIAVTTDVEWKSFKSLVSDPRLDDPRFGALAGRVASQDELDAVVARWTAAYDASELMSLLQSAGVPAGIVADGRDLDADPQLRHRGMLRELRHTELGICEHEAPPFRLSGTPADLNIAAPCLGEHTEYVCRNILGLNDKQYRELVQVGAFKPQPEARKT